MFGGGKPSDQARRSTALPLICSYPRIPNRHALCYNVKPPPNGRFASWGAEASYLSLRSFVPSQAGNGCSQRREMVVHEEETTTVVVDVGSSSVKAGFSGEDMPRAVFPSVAEDLVLSQEELSTYRARRPEVHPPEDATKCLPVILPKICCAKIISIEHDV